MKRVAFIGLGAAARRIHLPACRRLSARLSLVGGADPDPAARTWAGGAGFGATFDDPEVMIDQVRPDLVIVCSPPDLHRDHALLAVSRGAHVLLEKPMAPSLDEADEIIEAARRTGRRIVINNQFPHMRMHAAARAEVDGPRFGRLLHLHAWHTMRPTAATESGWRGRMTHRLGMEFGIHVLDLTRFFFGQTPEWLFAHLPRPSERMPFDVINTVTLGFRDGRGASISLDRASRGPERYLDLRLDGEEAAIHTSLGGGLQLRAGIHTRERRPFLEWRLPGGGRAVWQDGTRSRLLATDPLNPFAAATVAHLTAILDAIDGDTPLRTDAAANRDTLAMALAVYRSAELRQPVGLSEP